MGKGVQGGQSRNGHGPPTVQTTPDTTKVNSPASPYYHPAVIKTGLLNRLMLICTSTDGGDSHESYQSMSFSRGVIMKRRDGHSADVQLETSCRAIKNPSSAPVLSHLSLSMSLTSAFLF